MSDQGIEPTGKPKSKYTLVETPDGLLIQREGGLELPVFYANTYLFVDEVPVGLYSFKTLVEKVAEWFADQLVGRKRKRDIEEAQEMIAGALRGRLYPHWRRIVEQIAPPDKVKLARLMWASTQLDAWVLHQPELYADSFLLRDLEKYHACRMLARALESNYGTPPTPETRIEWFGKLRNWRDELAPTVPNKALNKTLDKLPTGVSYSQITRLAVMHLEQPITNRLHLIFALCAAGHHNFGLHERIVLTADATAIQTAAALFDEHLTARSRTRDIHRAASLILDYPQRFGGDLLGLARRSQEWHEEMHRYEASEEYGLPAEYPLPQPEVDLAALETAGISLLKTAGDVFAEGERMHHCVASYATKAAGGECYLFHVEQDDSSATVEVLSGGYVSQAYGPHNSRNPACVYGVKMLEEAFKGETAEEKQA